MLLDLPGLLHPLLSLLFHGACSIEEGVIVAVVIVLIFPVFLLALTGDCKRETKLIFGLCRLARLCTRKGLSYPLLGAAALELPASGKLPDSTGWLLLSSCLCE